MEHYSTTSGDLTLYSQHAYGGWSVHIHDDRQHRWLHQGGTYFATTEEAQAKALELAGSLIGHALPAVHWKS